MSLLGHLRLCMAMNTCLGLCIAIGGAEHRYIAENIEKYRNTAKKSANIAIPHRKSTKYRNRKNLVYYLHYALQLTRIVRGLGLQLATFPHLFTCRSAWSSGI